MRRQFLRATGLERARQTGKRLDRRAFTRGRHRLHPFQRHVRRALLPGNHGAGRGALRLRQRRRPRRLSGAEPDARQGEDAEGRRLSPPKPAQGPPLSQRPERERHAALHRRHRRQRHRRRDLRHGCRGRRLRQRRLRGPVSHRAQGRRAAAQQRQRHLYRCHGEVGRRRSRRLGRVGLFRRLRPRRLPRPVRRQLPALQH